MPTSGSASVVHFEFTNLACDEPSAEIWNRSRSRRKSVTFTKDTKQEDGISAKSLTGKHPKSDAFESITESTEATPLPSKEKKKRKRQQAEASETADSTQKPQYLEYLERFENDRDHWKFNKHNQSNLLKHIFDIKRIPVSYNKAIAGYLSGLQGNEARERLVESATEVLKDVAEKEEGGLRIESMESVQARRDAYAASLRRQIERVDRFGLSEHDKHELEDMKDEVERGRRAENILSQMLQQQSQAGEAAWMARSSLTNGTTSSDGSQVPTAGTASQGSVSTTSSSGKKRKSRTPASSSDDSDSDIEGEDRGAPRPRIENAVTKATYGTARGEPKVYQPLETMATGKKIIFDEALLDDLFPRPKTASVGTRTAANAQDSESDSGSESESDSDSSDSESDSE